MPKSLDRTLIRRLNKGGVDKFWKADLHGSVLTTTVGDIGTEGTTTAKTYPSPNDAYTALMQDETDKFNREYYEITADTLALLQGAAAVAPPPAGEMSPPAKSVAPPQVVSSKGPSITASVTAAGAARGTNQSVAREGPYAAAFTADTIHRLNLRQGKPSVAGAPPRATSGGQAIMAVGQAWPICTYCDTPMALYLQFDIEEAHQLAFAPGSHFLLFQCLQNHVPVPFSGSRIPESWLEPDFRSSYRLILNPPGVGEAVHAADPTVKEQQLTFRTAKEKVRQGLDGLVGQPKVKVGGIPDWVQPPFYPECACGAPMGFIMQVPTDESPGWMSSHGSPLPFAGGLSAYLFACTAQSSPYAAVMIAQR